MFKLPSRDLLSRGCCLCHGGLESSSRRRYPSLAHEGPKSPSCHHVTACALPIDTRGLNPPLMYSSHCRRRSLLLADCPPRCRILGFALAIVATCQPAVAVNSLAGSRTWSRTCGPEPDVAIDAPIVVTCRLPLPLLGGQI
jgi:hypothetical protein